VLGKALMRLCLLTGALLMTVATSVPGVASAAPSSPSSEANASAQFKAAAAATGFQRIRNAAFSQCVDAPGGVPNVRLKLATCSSGSTQRWALVPTGATNTFFVVNGSGFCMEVNNGTSTPGETVDQFDCNGLTSEQWVLGEGLTIRHAGTNQCLDTVGGRGSQLMQFTCGQSSPAAAQSWVIE
jgi:hypothetical protein